MLCHQSSTIELRVVTAAYPLINFRTAKYIAAILYGSGGTALPCPVALHVHLPSLAVTSSQRCHTLSYPSRDTRIRGGRRQYREDWRAHHRPSAHGRCQESSSPPHSSPTPRAHARQRVLARTPRRRHRRLCHIAMTMTRRQPRRGRSDCSAMHSTSLRPWLSSTHCPPPLPPTTPHHSAPLRPSVLPSSPASPHATCRPHHTSSSTCPYCHSSWATSSPHSTSPSTRTTTLYSERSSEPWDTK